MTLQTKSKQAVSISEVKKLSTISFLCNFVKESGQEISHFLLEKEDSLET